MIFWTKTNGKMSFNQTFVITTTFVYIDPNTSINLCWRDFYFSFFKNLNQKTRYYASNTICTYLHILWAWLSKKRGNERKQLGLNSNVFVYSNQTVLGIFGTENVIQIFFHKLSFCEKSWTCQRCSNETS